MRGSGTNRKFNFSFSKKELAPDSSVGSDAIENKGKYFPRRAYLCVRGRADLRFCVSRPPAALCGLMPLRDRSFEVAVVVVPHREHVLTRGIWKNVCVVAGLRQGLGISRLPCFLCDEEPLLCRLNYKLPAPTWGVWLLNHIDMRSSARVRVGREFLTEAIEAKRELILGEASEFFKK